jgi:hypothetical protein
VQDYNHYTQPAAEEHTNENAQPKAKSAAANGWFCALWFIGTALQPFRAVAGVLTLVNAFTSGVLSFASMGPILFIWPPAITVTRKRSRFVPPVDSPYSITFP